VRDWQQAWMKCVALLAPGTSSGPLLVMMPIAWPSMRAWPQTVAGPYRGENSRKSESSTMRAIACRMSTGRR
jgi:hypothetical protein